MISTIEGSAIWNGRLRAPTWWHPRACMVPGEPRPTALMTRQWVTRSDVFGPVHWSESRDMGASWTEPQYHPPTGSE